MNGETREKRKGNYKGRQEGRHAKKYPERAHILSGPLGPDFWTAVEQAAEAANETFSQYVRAAVLQRMAKSGRPFKKKKAKVA